MPDPVGISIKASQILDETKKCTIYGKQIDLFSIMQKLAEIEFYLARFRGIYLIDCRECVAHNIAKLSKRYEKLTFSDAAAIARADKE